MISRTYITEGMKSGECSQKIEAALNKLEGITAKVDLNAGTSTVYSAKYIDDKQIIDIIEKSGYHVRSV